MIFPISAILAILAIVGVLGTVLSAVYLRKVVPTNMVHIVQSAAKTVEYGKGRQAGNSYYRWPSWIPRIGVIVSEFPESIFDVSLTAYEAYDQGRLPFIVDVKAFFRVSDASIAAQRVSSFGELREQLTAVLQGAVRRILSTNHLESIMQDRSGLGKQFTDEVDAQLIEWGVSTVKSIEFMDIRDTRDTKVIHNMMAKEQSRIEKESKVVVAGNQREAEQAVITAQQEVDIKKQEAAQQVGLRTAQTEQAVGIAREQAAQQVQAEAKVTTERRMEVQRVQNVQAAQIDKDVKIVEAERDREVSVVSATAAKEVAIVVAQGDRESQVQIAEGKLAATLKNAEGLAAEGTAKAAAEQAMLMAPVNSQITLAKEIGENEGYQQYLVTVKKVEAEQAVGIAMAAALERADLKVIANSGDVQSGMGKLSDVLSAGGGTKLGGMVSALMQNPDVANLVKSATQK